MTEIGWKKRLALVLSVLWLVLALVVSRGERDSFGTFLILGALPLAVLWGIACVWSCFRKNRPAVQTNGIPPAQLDMPVPRAKLFTSLGLVLAAVAIGLLYYALSESQTFGAAKIGYMIGFYFWVPIAVYFIWKYQLGARKGRGVLLIGLAFLAVSGYESYAMLRETAEAKRLLAGAQGMMLKLMSGERVERSEVTGYGQFTPALLLMQDFVASVQTDFLALNQSIERSELETLLTPRVLRDPAAMSQAKRRLVSLRQQIDDTERRILAAYARFPSSIDHSDLPYRFKAEFRSGAERGVASGRASMATFFRIQRQFIDEALSLLTFLQQRKGSYAFRGDQILFAVQDDLNRYNGHIQKIQQLALQEAEWRNSQVATTAKQLRKMQDLGK